MIGRMLTVAPTIGAPWPDRLEEECSKIFSVCERAIELHQPDLGFRESIIGAILQCYFAHHRRIHPKPVSGKVYWRVPADAVESSLHGNAMIIKVSIDELLWASETAAAYAFPKRKTGKKGREDIAGQPAFECLIMSL